MNFTGFIKEYDNIPSAFAFSDMFVSEIDQQLLSQIISYLDNGMYVVGWMHVLSDLKTNEYLCPHGYYTDGTWVWPLYYTSYLKKYTNFGVAEEFLVHMKTKGFLNDVKTDPAVNIREIEKEVINKTSKKPNAG